MARISIEDCLENIENRFALVTIASHRTRQLMNGKTPFLKTKNKEAVTALREIAEGFIEGQQGYTKQNRSGVGFAASAPTPVAAPVAEATAPTPVASPAAEAAPSPVAEATPESSSEETVKSGE